MATDILQDYAADQPDLLADLLADAEAKDFVTFLSALHSVGKSASRSLTKCLAEKPADGRQKVKTVCPPAGEPGCGAAAVGRRG